MDYVVPVAVVHRCQNLPKLLTSLVFTHPSIGRQIVCKEQEGLGREETSP